MIYTKRKVGYYMGNTDIVATSLPDANAKNTTGHSTIFDDVFRTIAQKMPQLLIPLINEVFHTSYSEAEHRSVKPPHFTLERESLKDKAINTIIGR